MNPAVIIPTFHTAPTKRGAAKPSRLYDHPTPLNEQGTLGRCLNSLQQVRGLGQVIILVAAEGGVEDEAAKKVQNIANQFPQMHTLVIGRAEAEIEFEESRLLDQRACKEAGVFVKRIALQ